MNVTLKAIVSSLAVINFPSLILTQNALEGEWVVGIENNELACLLETGMRCRLEYPDKSMRDVKVREITKQNHKIVLNCVEMKAKAISN